MFRAIETFPGLCVTQPEIGSGIDDEHTWPELAGDPGAGPVRQRQEDNLMPGQVLCRGGGDLATGQGRQVRLMLSETIAHGRTARQGPDFHLRMLQQQPQYLTPRVSRASCDGNLETHNGNYAAKRMNIPIVRSPAWTQSTGPIVAG